MLRNRQEKYFNTKIITHWRSDVNPSPEIFFSGEPFGGGKKGGQNVFQKRRGRAKWRCSSVRDYEKATAVALKIWDMTGGKIFLTPEEILQKCDSCLLDFYFVKIFLEVGK